MITSSVSATVATGHLLCLDGLAFGVSPGDSGHWGPVEQIQCRTFVRGTRVNCSDRDRKTSRDNRPNRKEGRIREGAGRALAAPRVPACGQLAMAPPPEFWRRRHSPAGAKE